MLKTCFCGFEVEIGKDSGSLVATTFHLKYDVRVFVCLSPFFWSKFDWLNIADCISFSFAFFFVKNLGPFLI